MRERITKHCKKRIQ